MNWTQADLDRKGIVELEGGGYAKPSQLGKLITGVPKHKVCDHEGDLHNSILGYCKSMGWPVVHSRMDVPATCEVGTPDFVIAMPGPTTLWIEAKARQEKPKPKQLAWLAALRKVGHRAEVVRSMAEFLKIAQEETNPNRA